MKPNFTKTVAALSLGMAIQAAFAGNITDINVSVLPNQQRVIKVKFDRDVVEPSGFITGSPARIALDFPNTDMQLSQNTLSFNDSLLNQVVAAQANGRTRVLLGLTKEGEYNTQVKGNEVWVYVNEASNAVASSGTQTAGSYAAASNAPLNIDFNKGANGSGVIKYSLDPRADAKVQVRNDRLIITIKDYPIATQDQKNLDVTDFSTPVRNIVARRLGGDTQITVTMQGAWEHRLNKRSGYNELIIVRGDSTSSRVAQAKQQKFTGKNVSLDFQNVDVRTILQILAKESGTNIVASDNVQGQMTLVLKDVPWDQALAIVMDARDLGMKRNGNVINIAPRKDISAQEQSILEDQQKLENMAPLLTRNFQLKYKKVEEFREVLKITDGGSGGNNGRNSILSSRGSVLIDPATNTLIVTDNATVIAKFEKLIDELDRLSDQVMVEARIVEAEDTVSRDLGVKFGFSRVGRTGWGNTWDNAINNRNVVSGTGAVHTLGSNVNLPVSAATSSISLVRSISSGALGLEISAMETDNRAKTISSPRVLTQDRKAAEIKQGFQIPYQTRDANGAYTTAFKDAVLSLKVTPNVTPDRKILLDIAINKDDVSTAFTNLDGEPAISTKQVTTQAIVEDGGTLVVGGVYQERLGNVVSKVPVLGDLPVLGNLFKSRQRKNERNEVLFFITPRIMGAESSVMRY
ncbi:type IV pilus secretin PilQ [Alysiella filiformis]|uniref:Type IV pilus biogenesis and competence protein PilQ n=1 Tax=Alysiella filiformis DSM 16848 TaxID=1120981 RepID=A0A286EHF4_9NEIS|nr:type IV pilus secretin PilQ [Alysiella filiformis]QMT32333.1 type IV pilus secretin PilQ [Alysiella filiformis]UBQ56747.1 type IV pilus secretin PilQ [Alysiella filiformis DSM 16848]SOD70347.1 type IV pilus assembly protein PilQ [Alysiella filiformis DSM 16848]